MPTVKVYNQQGEVVGATELNPAIFAVALKPELIQQAVVAQQANTRRPIAKTKDRSEVRGGGRKPWRQKGTGRARHGSIRSPLWRGGGVTFGPTNQRNFALKINKKAKRKALAMVLTDKARQEKIILLDQLVLAETKTKKLFEILQNLKLRSKKLSPAAKKSTVNPAVKKSQPAVIPASPPPAKNKLAGVLLVLAEKDQKINRAGRNLPQVRVTNVNSLNLLEVLQYQYFLTPLATLKKLDESLVKS